MQSLSALCIVQGYPIHFSYYCNRLIQGNNKVRQVQSINPPFSQQKKKGGEERQTYECEN